MDEYRVPADFTGKVMDSVRTYEHGRKAAVPLSTRLLANPLLRWGLSCSAALLGALHLLRLGLNFLAPIVCR